MLTIRLASPTRDAPHPLALATQFVLKQRALPIDGTVLLGTGDPLAVLPIDSGPRIVVPFALSRKPGALGRAQIHLADAVVVLHRDEASLLRDQIDPQRPVVVVAPDSAPLLLVGANPEENLQALEAVAEHHVLASHIPAWRTSDEALGNLARGLADAVEEAVIVASRPV